MTKYRVVRRPGSKMWLVEVEEEYTNWRGKTKIKRSYRQTYALHGHWSTKYESRKNAEEAIAYFKWQDEDKGELGEWV